MSKRDFAKYGVLAFAVLAIVVLGVHDSRDVPFASSLGKAIAIVGGVFVLVVAVTTVAWSVHRRREAKRLRDLGER